MSTLTKTDTIKDELNNALPGKVEPALFKLGLGDLLTPIVDVSGVITATASYKLAKKVVNALKIQVIASGTAGAIGQYILGEVGIDPGGAGTAVGVCTLGADFQTITFLHTVTSVKITYFGTPDLSKPFLTI